MSVGEKRLQVVSSMITEAYNHLVGAIDKEIVMFKGHHDAKFEHDLRWSECELNGLFDGLKNNNQRDALFRKHHLSVYERLVEAEKDLKVAGLERKGAEINLDKRKSELRVIDMELRVEELAHANTSSDA
jgi:hypothetical protein